MVQSVEIAEMASEIVSAYVRNNRVATSDLSDLIKQVHSALTGLTANPADIGPDSLTPAVPIKKSVTSDYIVCLEDGRRLKSLKRHLKARYSMSPEQYRAKWGLPSSYPMVAPGYAELRSNLARKMGLGQARSAQRAGEKRAPVSPNLTALERTEEDA